MGENTCIAHIQYGVNIKNIQGTLTTQQQTNKQTKNPITKQAKDIEISPKKIYKWPTDI